MVFHHPFPVASNGTSGSRVRPYQMLHAFKALGYEVLAVTGYARERKRQIERLRVELHKGRRIEFVYSESHTMPTLLTEPHHIPTHPFLDFPFLRVLRERDIPIGLFYRDVNWRFDQFKTFYPAWKRYYATFFYRYDWRQYRTLVDHLFLPSLGMCSALPTAWPPAKASALPPGIDAGVQRRRSAREPMDRLNILYVGGVRPPLYDISPLFEFVSASHQVSLTLCCRLEEWRGVASQYRVPHNVNIVHRSGKQLNSLYEQADAVAILWRPHSYLNFATPVKLFEALAHGLPIITSPATETAHFVAQERVGWVVESVEEFGRLVTSLLQHRGRLEEIYRTVANAQSRHTWLARAQQVANTLSTVQS